MARAHLWFINISDVT